MVKHSLFSDGENRATELMLGEKKTAAEAAEVLTEEGYSYTPAQLGVIKRRSFDLLVREQKAEVTASFLLESTKKNTLKFEEVFEKFESLYNKYEEEGKDFQQLIVLRDLKDMLNMSLRKLGEYKTGFEKIQNQQINIITNTDVMSAIEQNQNTWFRKMDPEVKDGKLIFNKPTAEVLDAYSRFNFRNNKPKVISVL